MSEITVIAHNIRSTHNVGAIFRTCEGFGIKNIVLSGYTPYPRTADDSRLPHIADKLTTQIHKTALGAETMVQFEHYENLEEWLKRNECSSNQLPVLALEQASNSRAIGSVTPPQSFALLLGEELNGIEQQFLKRCDQILEIPMSGKKESFNVSVACGIALYALSFDSNTLSPDHIN